MAFSRDRHVRFVPLPLKVPSPLGVVQPCCMDVRIYVHARSIGVVSPADFFLHILNEIAPRPHDKFTPGVSIVGLSGSMIKDTVKETVTEVYNVLVSPSSLHTRSAGSLNPDSTEAPEATKVLVGIFFILFAQILSVKDETHLSISFYTFFNCSSVFPGMTRTAPQRNLS